MLETVLPLIHFMKQEKSSGSDKLGGTIQYIRYSDRKKWFYKKPKNRSSLGRTIVFKTFLNCGHACIKNVISTILPELDCIVCYKKTVTLANLCK